MTVTVRRPFFSENGRAVLWNLLAEEEEEGESKERLAECSRGQKSSLRADYPQLPWAESEQLHFLVPFLSRPTNKKVCPC